MKPTKVKAIAIACSIGFGSLQLAQADDLSHSPKMEVKKSKKEKKHILSRQLEKKLKSESIHKGKKHKVVLVLKDEERAPIRQEQGTVELDENGDFIATIDGVKYQNDEINKKHHNKQADKKAFQKKRLSSKVSKLKLLSKKHRFLGDSELGLDRNDNHNSRVVSLTAEEIEQLSTGSDGIIVAIEEYIEPSDDIDSAMQVTGVANSALINSNLGDDVNIYMTESGCPNAGFMTGYTRLGGNRTNHSENVSSILRAVAPDSQIFCRGGATLPTSSDMTNNTFDIITRSNSIDTNGVYNSTARDWDNFAYDNDIPIFLSAGNEGNTGDVTSPGIGFNILAVGNHCDNLAISTGSSGLNPDTGIEKPDFSAPGCSITAGGFTMGGTSQSTPHAAGMLADVLSSYTWIKGKPYLVKAMMLAGARLNITGNADATGEGGLNFNDIFYNTSMWWGTGGSTTFDAWKDPLTQTIDYNFDVSSTSGEVTVVVAWMESGTWTFNNRDELHPIGTDYDLTVYAPNGSIVGGSSSVDNTHELVTFSPNTTGTYTAKVSRYSNSNANGGIKMAIVAHRH